MVYLNASRVLAAVSLLCVWTVAPAAAQQAGFVQALDRMMIALGPESARDSHLIREAYRAHLDLLVLEDYAALEEALWNGGVAALPRDPRFNLAPRLTGYSPIGEKDPANQVSYVAARPAAIGALLDIASRVTSGPVEVTSLVRHTEYQGTLSATNANARTSVPMHTMGLAFDIALVNTPLETVYEIRDVLRAMRRAGDILFVGERRQLVFHVVPRPSRLGHYTGVYAKALGMPRADSSGPLVRFTPAPPSAGAPGRPRVTAEVAAVIPTSEIAADWWAAEYDHGNLAVEVRPPADVIAAEPERIASTAPPPFAALFVGLLAFARRAIIRREPVARLF